MTVPSYDEALKTARDNPAFSNGTEWEIWSYNWCERCTNDSPEMVDRGDGCSLIAVAMFEQKTPAEWMEQEDRSPSDRYHCISFRSEDDGPDPEPKPIPDPPGQLTLTPREPFEQARMLTSYPERAEVSV